MARVFPPDFPDRQIPYRDRDFHSFGLFKWSCGAHDQHPCG